MSDQFIGQERWRDYFHTVLSADRLATGYLFVGPAHIGKKTFARDIARTILCLSRNVCGTCSSCRAWSDDSHPELVVLRPNEKGIIGIDEAREFTQRLSQRGYVSGWRVGLIHCAQALTTPAANALLKTLEEPPRDVVMIVLAERAELLPTTVRSRLLSCQFAPVPAATLTTALIARGFALAVAERVTRLSRGCPGFALQLAGDSVAESKVVRQGQDFFALLRAPLAERFAFTESVATEERCAKRDLEKMLSDWQGWLHDACRATFGVPELATVTASVARFSPEHLLRATTALFQARRDLAGPANRRLALNTFFLQL